MNALRPLMTKGSAMDKLQKGLMVFMSALCGALATVSADDWHGMSGHGGLPSSGEMAWSFIEQAERRREANNAARLEAQSHMLTDAMDGLARLTDMIIAEQARTEEQNRRQQEKLNAALYGEGDTTGGRYAIYPTEPGLYDLSSRSRSGVVYEEDGRGRIDVYPTEPGCPFLRSLREPGMVYEKDSDGRIHIYYTEPGTTLRSQTQPGVVVEQDGRGRLIAYPTLPGTTIRDYNEPGYVIEER